MLSAGDMEGGGGDNTMVIVLVVLAVVAVAVYLYHRAHTRVHTVVRPDAGVVQLDEPAASVALGVRMTPDSGDVRLEGG